MSSIPEDLSVLVVQPTQIKGNKCGLLMLLNSIATALADRKDTGEFLDLSGDCFEIVIQCCSNFEEIEVNTNNPD